MRKNLIPLLVCCLLSTFLPTPVQAAAFTLPPRASGPKDAAIVIEVYSDFQCPFCREFHLRTVSRIIEDYCDKGKVYLVHRDRPWPQLHAYAVPAARWAIACATVGKYEAVAQALFEKQDVWAANGNIEAVIATQLTASQLKSVKQVLSSHQQQIDAEIQQDLARAQSDQANATPMIKITKNGNVIAPAFAAPSYAIVKRFLDQQLVK